LSQCKIVTDISSGLSQAAVTATRVQVVPMTVYAGHKEQPIEFVDPDEFWRNCNVDYRGTVRIAQPSPGDFFNIYNRLLAEDVPILSIHSSEIFSKTVRAAGVAAELIGESSIQVIDSGLIGPPMGQAVLEAAAMADEDRHIEEIAGHVEMFAARVRAFFHAAEPNYLSEMQPQGISALTSKFRSLMQGNLYSLADGRLIPLKKRLQASQVPEHLLELALKQEDRSRQKTSLVGVMSAGTGSQATRLKKLFKQESVEAEIEQWTIDPVLGVFLGPGSTGVFTVE